MSESPKPIVVDSCFQKAKYPSEVFSYAHHMKLLGVTKAQAKRIVSSLQQEEVYRSGSHQVAVRRYDTGSLFGKASWLSIKRIDRSVIDDRTELLGVLRAMRPGWSAYELLPAPDRLVDEANQYHLTAFEGTTMAALAQVELAEPTAHGHLSGWRLRFDAEAKALDALFVTDPPHLGDWRGLFDFKETHFPGCEAALFLAADDGHPLHLKMLVLTDPKLRFPFGMVRGSVNESAAEATGARQRPLHERGTAG